MVFQTGGALSLLFLHFSVQMIIIIATKPLAIILLNESDT